MSASMTTTAPNGETFPTVTREVWLAKRCCYRSVFDGVTDGPIRRERFRAWIVESDRAHKHAGTFEGKDYTFAQVFEQFYGVRL